MDSPGRDEESDRETYRHIQIETEKKSGIERERHTRSYNV